jgi:hypothetical protein
VFLNYPCIPSISPENREYTVDPTILFESLKRPSDKKCLGPINPLIRTWYKHKAVSVDTNHDTIVKMIHHEVKVTDQFHIRNGDVFTGASGPRRRPGAVGKRFLFYSHFADWKVYVRSGLWMFRGFEWVNLISFVFRLIIFTTLGDEYKLWRFSVWTTFPLSYAQIFPSGFCSQTQSMFFSLRDKCTER